MWWQGLPTNVRGKVWKLAIGNDLNLTPGLSSRLYNYLYTKTFFPLFAILKHTILSSPAVFIVG